MTINPTPLTAQESVDFRLDSLLADWFLARDSDRFTRGYSKSDATCRDHRAPGHWDWWNGAADAKAEDLRVRAVDKCMDRIPNTPRPWNTALQFEARNIAMGAAVWISPRLPQDREERQVLVLEARNMLLRELQRAGVITA